MPRMEEQIKSLKAQLAQRDEIIVRQQDMIGDLNKQLLTKIEDSPLYKSQVDTYRTVEIELELSNREIARLQKIITEQTEQIQELTNRQAIVTHTATPVAHRRGAKPKADIETRQYMRELYKLGRSIRDIGTAVGMSVGQTHAIVHEADVPGVWYTVNGDGRTYYSSYHEAFKSGDTPHYEIAQ